MEVFINIFLQYPSANITEEINIMVISPCSIYFDFHPINTTIHLKNPKCYKNTEYFHCSFRNISLQNKFFRACGRRGILGCLVNSLPKDFWFTI